MTGDKEALKLRKAKADGVRLAAKFIEGCGECKESDHIGELRAMAEKIEVGEA